MVGELHGQLLSMATEVCREAWAGQLVEGPLLGVTWAPGSQSQAFRLPLSAASSRSFAVLVLFSCSRRGRGDGRRGGKWRQGEGGKGGEASVHRERVKENESGERESLPSVWPSSREARIGRAHCFPSSCHPERQGKKRKQRQGQKMSV